MAYNPRKFLDNVNKIVQDQEKTQKNAEIGKLISSLQRPFQDVLQSVVLEQHKQVNELLKSVGWRK